MTILYFTATGNSLYVAKRLGGELVSIPQAIRENRYEFRDDKIGLVFPVYWLRVPLYVERFLQKARLVCDYLFAIPNYGGFSGNVAGHLQQIGDEIGMKFHYIQTIKMSDNYLPGYAMENQIVGEPRKQIEKHLDEIISQVGQGKEFLPKPMFMGKLLIGMMKRNSVIGKGISEKVRVEDSCARCSTCAIVCPLDNITVEQAKPVFGTQCMSCMACTQNCPRNSIRLTNEKSTVRFRNQHISLKEIMEANR